MDIPFEPHLDSGHPDAADDSDQLEPDDGSGTPLDKSIDKIGMGI